MTAELLFGMAASTGVPGRKREEHQHEGMKGCPGSKEGEETAEFFRVGNLHRLAARRTMARPVGRRGVPLLKGGGMEVEWGSGGEGVEQEEVCANIYGNGRCTVHSVWRGRKEEAAAAYWTNGAAWLRVCDSGEDFGGRWASVA